MEMTFEQCERLAAALVATHPDWQAEASAETSCDCVTITRADRPYFSLWGIVSDSLGVTVLNDSGDVRYASDTPIPCQALSLPSLPDPVLLAIIDTQQQRIFDHFV